MYSPHNFKEIRHSPLVPEVRGAFGHEHWLHSFGMWEVRTTVRSIRNNGNLKEHRLSWRSWGFRLLLNVGKAKAGMTSNSAFELNCPGERGYHTHRYKDSRRP
jgi:hypothetical protein